MPPVFAVAQQRVAHGHHVRILAGPGFKPDRPTRPADDIRTIGATPVAFHQVHDPFASSAAIPVERRAADAERAVNERRNTPGAHFPSAQTPCLSHVSHRHPRVE